MKRRRKAAPRPTRRPPKGNPRPKGTAGYSQWGFRLKDQTPGTDAYVRIVHNIIRCAQSKGSQAQLRLRRQRRARQAAASPFLYTGRDRHFGPTRTT